MNRSFDGGSVDTMNWPNGDHRSLVSIVSPIGRFSVGVVGFCRVPRIRCWPEMSPSEVFAHAYGAFVPPSAGPAGCHGSAAR